MARRMKLLGVDSSYTRLATLQSLQRPLVFYHWTEEEVLRLALASRSVGLGANVSFVVDDTLGGRVGAVILERYGFNTIQFRIANSTTALRDTRTLIRHPGHLSISADGRGPYRVVNRRLPHLVRARRALAVPVSVRASDALVTLSRPWPLIVPGVRTEVSVVIGDAIELRPGDGEEVLAGGLSRACVLATDLLGRGTT